ncbi:class I SAM-dependent methyltransferase [Streptomyces sp. Tu 6176]|uniref:class I SAM-dependent methyltransferase n=1 Tax=Streptomyces sp. Tu 6176 TaxID=1470557 RepID=UPI0026A146E3
MLDAVGSVLERTGPYTDGLDLCCGTGAGLDVLRRVCRTSVTGVDFSAGMLDVARRRPGRATEAAATGTGDSGAGDSGAGDSGAGDSGAGDSGPRVSWVRGDARALPFTAAFDLVVSLGALGHFVPAELPLLFGRVSAVLRPGGVFALPVFAPPPPCSRAFWTLLGFDAVMRVRNAVWRPPFVMYYRAFRFGDVLRGLERAGLRPELHALPGFGRRADGSPRARLIAARRLP